MNLHTYPKRFGTMAADFGSCRARPIIAVTETLAIKNFVRSVQIELAKKACKRIKELPRNKFHRNSEKVRS